MTKTWIIALVAAGLLVSGLVLTSPVSATKTIAQQEDLSCTVCHDKPGSKRFTDRGKFYDLMGGFDGYDELTAKFGECTTCHKRRPGSTRLTTEGKRWAEVHGDMEALCKQAIEERRKGSETAEPEASATNPGDGSAPPQRFMPSH